RVYTRVRVMSTGKSSFIRRNFLSIRQIDLIPFRHTLPTMSVVGETLRNARQARRISLNQASLETRIRQSVLEALEEGDYAALPPRPFLRGLIRNYALYLNLDPDTLLKAHDAETRPRHRPPPEPPLPEPLPPEPTSPSELPSLFDSQYTETPD